MNGMNKNIIIKWAIINNNCCKEMHRWIQIHKITEKVKLLYVRGWHETVCQNGKINRNFDTNNKNIHPGYRNGIWHWKTHHATKENWKRDNGRNRIAEFGM